MIVDIPRTSSLVPCALLAAGLLLGAGAGDAPAQSTRAPPEPTVLERMSALGATEVLSATEVGRLVSGGTRAVATALVLENAHAEPRRVRGLRIDLSSGASTDRIYLDEVELVYHVEELNFLDCSAELDSVRNNGGTMSIARCRPSQTEAQTYCPSYRTGEGVRRFNVSTYTGNRYSFETVRAARFAELIDRALDEFGLDSAMPRSDNGIGLPPDELDRIFAAAVGEQPELASSAGIKAAQYYDRERLGAWAVFEPHSRSGDFAQAYSVSCRAQDAEREDWRCGSLRPRGYLSLPDQEAEVVITGPLTRDKAVALVAFARRVLVDERGKTAAREGTIYSVHPPDASVEFHYYHVGWRDGHGKTYTLEIDDAPGTADGFELRRLLDHERPDCGAAIYRTDPG